ncbi:hypothetical protein K3152_03830 [Qipengyuania sp. 1NDH17]|uniref:Uncharacterized protein n=1 Tax=Qipengyuania polymorpha TaxID=2867234 RepID=A0ABS7IV94_9SPHN|nr:hypothetical protein [Qipengyuania polymorpha]MBX7457368.1 hypothetical protein [Qipengyuania polymorpha]
MAIEDRSWQGQIYQLGVNHRAASYRRWFKRDGADWIFAGSFGHRFCIDTKTAGAIFAEGVDIEHEATSAIPSGNDLTILLPLGFLGMVPLVWSLTYGPTPVAFALWAVWLFLGFFLGGKTDNRLLFSKWRMRRNATRRLLDGSYRNWRSFAPLHWPLALYEFFGLLIVAAIAAQFFLAEMGYFPFETAMRSSLVLVAVAWLVYLWMRKFFRRLAEEVAPLHGAAPISPDLARRLRTEASR